MAVVLTSLQDDSVKARFWAKVDVGEPNDCWGWQGSKNKQGYGSFYFEGRPDRAHRVAVKITRGEIPKGMFVCHRCDNPSFVNPNHLFLGTPADNVRDMMQKGRHVRAERDEAAVAYCRASASNLAKLDETTIKIIRQRRKGGERSMALAEEYGVDRTLIWQIATRRIWKHVD